MKTLTEWQEKEFNEFLKTKKNGVVEFGAPWCHACKLTEPLVAEMAVDHPDIVFAKIDVAKNPGLASRMGVMSLPNILFLNSGSVKEQIIGATNKKTLEDKLKKIAK